MRKQAATIVGSALGMSHLIADLLDLASIDSGTFSIATRPCTAAQLLRKVGDHGDTLRAESEVGRGSTLCFSLPCPLDVPAA